MVEKKLTSGRRVREKQKSICGVQMFLSTPHTDSGSVVERSGESQAEEEWNKTVPFGHGRAAALLKSP